MRLENAVASEVLERILSAYGFTMQKELSDRLEIAKSNVASWLARGQVPGNVIVQCSLDTGADVNWLVTGELEKANPQRELPNLTGKAVYDEIMANGGKSVLRRILDAYGFTQQKQLCELLDISSGTVSTWVRRNYFPGDVVVACALDTGSSLKWLALGQGKKEIVDGSKELTTSVPCMNLTDGALDMAGQTFIDFKIYKVCPAEPVVVIGNFGAWIIDENVKTISNGKWLLSIDDMYDIYEIALLPARRIKVINPVSDFTCAVNEVKVKGKVVLTITQ